MENMNSNVLLIMLAGALAMLFSFWKTTWINNQSQGNERMKSIGASFNDEPLSKFGFWSDWVVPPRWNLCNAPGEDGGKVNLVKAFLDSDDKVLVCTHATFRFAIDKFGVEAFDDRAIARPRK